MGWIRVGAIVAMLIGFFVAVLPKVLLWLMLWDNTPTRGTQTVFQFPKGDIDLKYSLVRGMPQVRFITDAQIDKLENDFLHRPGDVWVTTYQKAGTTWTQAIVNQILGHPPTDTLGIFKYCPWPEVAVGLLSYVQPSMSLIRKSAADVLEQPRCFKSHWKRKDHMAKLPPESKVVYVFREPEAVIESYWHHVQTLYFAFEIEGEQDVPFGKFFDMFLRGDVENGDYFEHLASWWKHRNDPNVLILHFNDLKHKHLDVVHRLSKFIGIPVNASRASEIVDLTSFKSMRQRDEQSTIIDTILKNYIGAIRGSHVRSGGEKEKGLLSASQKAKLRERYEAVLKPLGMPRETLWREA